jgi:hypothetical protein
MLDPTLWRPRLTVVYNKQKREAVEVRWQIQSRLTRIDINARDIKSTWNKSGDLYRLSEGVQVGQSRVIGWNSTYQVWPADNFYPYTLRWSPVPWFPSGRVQFWEYTGEISNAELLHYLQLDSSYPNADLAIQLEALRQSIENDNSPTETDGYDNPEIPVVISLGTIQVSDDGWTYG